MVRVGCWLPWAQVAQERRILFLGVLGIRGWYLLLFVIFFQKMKGMDLSWRGNFLFKFKVFKMIRSLAFLLYATEMGLHLFLNAKERIEL